MSTLPHFHRLFFLLPQVQQPIPAIHRSPHEPGQECVVNESIVATSLLLDNWRFIIIILLILLSTNILPSTTKSRTLTILILLLILTLKGAKICILTRRRPLPRSRQQNLINQPIPHSLLTTQIKITLHIRKDLIRSLPRHLRQLLLHLIIHNLHIRDFQSNIRRLSLKRLIHPRPLQEEARVGHGTPAALGARAAEHGAHSSTEAEVDRG
mmetsp:Transcript_4416/g.6747  ORF Transcript_4416/g.6747 Transcript_4416/m.6747 type:complete len:211 (-) Transcript_4416:512-1144(-)